MKRREFLYSAAGMALLPWVQEPSIDLLIKGGRVVDP